MLREIVVFFSLASVALAAVSIAQLEPKPEKFNDVDGCYIEDLEEVIPLDESAASKTSCSKYVCRSYNVLVETCGVVKAEPPCKLVEDPTKLYPDCCPTIECP